MSGPLSLPPNLVDAARSEGRTGWLDRLPGLVRTVAERWDLDVGGPFLPGGRTAWVAPARSTRHGDVVVKVARRHPESDHEADGLRLWGGAGMVRLLADHQPAADTTALLLERCRPGATLAATAAQDEAEQDAVVAALLQRLWIGPPPAHGIRPLADMCEMWAAEAERRTWPSGLDAGLARDGLVLFRELPLTAEREVLLCTDLHAGNVLSAGREPWLAIDPKPHVGEPTYDVLQHILNCDERLQADPHGLVRRLAGLLDLDAERLGLWLFARCVVEAPGRPELADVARRLAAPTKGSR